MSDQMILPTLANNEDYARRNAGLFCDVYRTVRPTQSDLTVISDQLVFDTLANNETEKRECKRKR